MSIITKTDLIFDLSAPYDNKYQGPDPRLLFVCSAGILRSATGANYFAKKGYNTRNCGTHDFALIPLSANLIMWADAIIFVNPDNYVIAKAKFLGTECYEAMENKKVVLTIEDDYDYNHPQLIKHFEALDKAVKFTRSGEPEPTISMYEDKPGDPKSTS